MNQDKIDKFRADEQQKAKDQNQQDNHNQVLQSLHDLLLATVVSKDPRLHDVARNLGDFLQQIAQASKDFQGSSLHLLPLANQELANSVQELTSRVQDLAPQDLTPSFQALGAKLDALAKKDTTVNVPETKVDLQPLISGLKDIKSALSDQQSQEFDTKGIIDAVNKVQDTLSNLRFPSPNYVLPFATNTGKATQVKLDASGNVPIAGTIAIDTTGLATSANQTTEITALNTIKGAVYAEDTASASADPGIQILAVRASSPANTSGNNGDYEPLQVNAGRLWVSSVIEAGSNVIGHVITDTGSTTAVTQATASNLNAAVVGTGTAGTPAGGVLTIQGVTSMTKLLVTPDSVALPANQSVNISQINAVTPLMGNGVTGTGSLRVTIASDNTAFAVNSTLSAETTKVIGVVRNSDGAGNLLTSNSTTFTAKFGLDSNLLGTLGTAFSTAGKVDVKGADGDLFVRQATASNLNATVVGTGTFAVQATLAAGATNIAKAEDVTSADGDVGVPSLAVRKATPANTSGTDGDYEFLQMSAGRLWVDASGKTLTVDGSGVTQPVSIAGTVVVDDLAASGTGSAVPANAQYHGNLAQTALPAAATAGNLVGSLGDKFGRSVVVLGTIRDLKASQTTTITSSTTETTVVTAGAAGIFNDLITVLAANTSATVCQVDFRDDTAGSVIFTLEVPANGTAGFSMPGESWPQTATAKNWTAKCGTSVASVIVSVLYEKNK